MYKQQSVDINVFISQYQLSASQLIPVIGWLSEHAIFISLPGNDSFREDLSFTTDDFLKLKKNPIEISKMHRLMGGNFAQWWVLG